MSLRNSLVSELVCENPRRVSVFEEHDIDYCRAGQRSLSNLCMELGLSVERLEEQLVRCDRDPFEKVEWALGEESLTSLVDYLEHTCHPQVRAKVERIAGLLQRIESVYGACNPEIVKARSAFEELRGKIFAHLSKEEEIFFDKVRTLDSLDSKAEPVSFLAVEEEHHELESEFARLREMTGNYRVPSYACGSYRVAYSELQQLEIDMKRFADLEDNVLFRRAALLSELTEPAGA